MKQIDTKQWKEFMIYELCETTMVGNKLQVPTGASVSAKQLKNGDIPKISVSGVNNGIVGYYYSDDKNYRVYHNFISVSFLGTVFYQEGDAQLDMKVHCLKLKGIELNRNLALFLITVIRKSIMLYNYADQISSTVLPYLSVKLPVDEIGNPDFSYMETYMKNLELAVSSSLTDLQSAKKFGVSKMLDTSNWKNFEIEDLFEKLELKTLKKDFNKTFDVSEIQNDEFTLPLVNAKHFNNGIMYYGRECDFEASEMTIDIVKNGAIATGDVYAQPQKTGVLWDAYLIKPKAEIRSELVLFFLATALEKAIKDKFSYDDKCIWQKVKKLSIPLPITQQNSPDYAYMEFYMTYILGNAKNVLTNLKTFKF